jgi:hypothetical protein
MSDTGARSGLTGGFGHSMCHPLQHREQVSPVVIRDWLNHFHQRQTGNADRTVEK